MAAQRLAPPRTNQRKEEEIAQGGRQAKEARCKKEEEKRKRGGHQGNDKGLKKDDDPVVKGLKGPPWQFKGKGSIGNGSAQQLRAETCGTGMSGDVHPHHLQVILQVREEVVLNRQQLGGNTRATGGPRTPAKLRGGGGGRGGGDGRKSSVQVAHTTIPSPETKVGQFRKEETNVGNKDGGGHTAPGHMTGKRKGKQATVVSAKDNPVKVPSTARDDVGLDVKDYLYLLKLLRINLPDGVLNTEVINLSKTQMCIIDARSITTELENFSLRFTVTPRLGCREVKKALALKTKDDVLELTKIIFFENAKEEDRETLMDTWKKNSLHTGKGFRMRERYQEKPISTPAVYSAPITRSLRSVEHKESKAKVTDGVRVNARDVEKMEYKDEHVLDKSGGNRFGMFHQNRTDEMECLKFLHELGEISASDQERVRYSKGNKVECSFLSGSLDFLAQTQRVSGRKSSEVERIVIECKGTTGDMVGKLFTKSEEANCAKLIKSHQYCYQAQAYMYILNQEARLLNRPVSNRAVMVIRHYHGDAAKQQDFYWSYLAVDDIIQEDISDLVLYCQREVLVRFLAVLDLIFQREMT